MPHVRELGGTDGGATDLKRVLKEGQWMSLPREADVFQRPMTLKELAELTGVPVKTWHREIAAGRLRAVKRRGTERPWYVKAEELERYYTEEFKPV